MHNLRASDPKFASYHYRARYYDPAPGRFLSEDPKRFGGGENFHPHVSSPTLLIPIDYLYRISYI
jgi:RHS repeat-associated protein